MALLETALLLRATHKILYLGDHIDFIGYRTNRRHIHLDILVCAASSLDTNKERRAHHFAPPQQWELPRIFCSCL